MKRRFIYLIIAIVGFVLAIGLAIVWFWMYDEEGSHDGVIPKWLNFLIIILIVISSIFWVLYFDDPKIRMVLKALLPLNLGTEYLLGREKPMPINPGVVKPEELLKYLRSIGVREVYEEGEEELQTIEDYLSKKGEAPLSEPSESPDSRAPRIDPKYVDLFSKYSSEDIDSVLYQPIVVSSVDSSITFSFR